MVLERKAANWLLIVVASISCTETNPNSCLATPSVCRAGTQCVKGSDKQGRGWSACLPVDGGHEQSTGDGSATPSGSDAPADTPLAEDVAQGADLTAPD